MYKVPLTREPDRIDEARQSDAEQIAEDGTVPEGDGSAVETDATESEDRSFGGPHQEDCEEIASLGKGDGDGMDRPRRKTRAEDRQESGFARAEQPDAQLLVVLAHSRAYRLPDRDLRGSQISGSALVSQILQRE